MPFNFLAKRDRGNSAAIPLFHKHKYEVFLLQGYLRALSLQLGLQILGLFLGNAGLNSLRSGINYVLSLLQAQAGSLTYNLDNLNLVGANLGQLNIKLGLLLLSCAASCSSCCYYNAGCCGYAELLLAGLNQLVQL